MDREPSVKTFPYTDETLSDLETALSRDRLRRYAVFCKVPDGVGKGPLGDRRLFALSRTL